MHGLRTVRSLALLVLLLSAVACSSPKSATGEVSGTVTYNNTFLPGGTITFMSVTDNEKVARVGINPKDGTYKLENAPEGDCKITVEGPPRPSDSSQGKKPPVTIPKKYLKSDTSGLTYTVKKGPQTFDVDLK